MRDNYDKNIVHKSLENVATSIWGTKVTNQNYVQAEVTNGHIRGMLADIQEYFVFPSPL
jgi:hypothetical protein